MLPYNINRDILFDRDNLKEIYLAGGCFWGVDAYMERVKGVYSTESGYANGHKSGEVTYKEVCTGRTGHTEAVFVKYDPKIIDLENLLKEFFSIIDPTTLNRQAADIGTQYRTGVYFTNDEDEEIVKKFIESIKDNYRSPIVTEVKSLENYCPAEEYHQKYLEKNPGGYCHIQF
ncbi:MAG: peptide-methionine (S)-S-oxide reductase MsrA [Defluviitaleaceae bacterium]|nr:peptide-methionine (S)-S-oxide reductase MsrA [Defluviitaleaceae bacterium]